MADEGEKSRPTILINFVSEVLVFVYMFIRFVLCYKVLESCLIYTP